MTVRPRMIVATGQPVVVMPSNGVQPQRDAIQLFSIVFFFFEIDDREVRVESARDAPLAGNAEDARGPRARQVDEALEMIRPAFTWSSRIVASVCTPGMPEGVSG